MTDTGKSVRDAPSALACDVRRGNSCVAHPHDLTSDYRDGELAAYSGYGHGARSAPWPSRVAG